MFHVSNVEVLLPAGTTTAPAGGDDGPASSAALSQIGARGDVGATFGSSVGIGATVEPPSSAAPLGAAAGAAQRIVKTRRDGDGEEEDADGEAEK